MIRGVDDSSAGALATNFLKCSLVTCALPASPSRNPSTRTYSDGSSTPRDHSKNKFPASLRVAAVNSETWSVKFSTYSAFGRHLTTMKIIYVLPSGVSIGPRPGPKTCGYGIVYPAL